MGDYIYYSTGDYTSNNMKYIQRDKNTGEEQVFFQDEFSMIVPLKGKYICGFEAVTEENWLNLIRLQEGILITV